MSGLDRAGAELTIDLAAIRRNYWQLNARLDPDAELGAVVKADAYGLGVSRIAPTLAQAGCKTYFVATLDEGIALRAAVEDATIYVLNGLVANELEDFFIHRLRQCWSNSTNTQTISISLYNGAQFGVWIQSRVELPIITPNCS